MNSLVSRSGLFMGVTCLVLSGCREPSEPVPEADRVQADRYLGIVREHLDAVLEVGRDHYGTPTPLFVDGLEVSTYEPARWPYDDHRWILSNLANQQDLLRTLDGFTALTGEKSYRATAEEVVEYHFDHLTTENGLLLWGGHTCWDAESDQWVGRRFHWLGKRRSPIHELKSCFPHYELFSRVDREATAQLIRSFWEAHIRDWSNLDFDRHGGMTRPKPPPGSEVWDRDFDPESPVFFQSEGRTFVQTGSDLYFAGGMLHHLDRDREALDWARRIASRYVATRHPETGLRGYQYSNLEDVDRAYEQFGDLFPESHVSEATIMDPNAMPKALLAQMKLAEKLEKEGEPFLQWAIADLIAIGRHSYDQDLGEFHTTLLDGTNLTETELPRDGYFGPKGTSFRAWPGQDFFLCFATASRLVPEDPFLWEMARHTARDAGLGDIGTQDGSGIQFPEKPDSSFPAHLMGLLELYRQTDRREYLDHACQVAEVILEQRYQNRLFTPGPDYRYTRTSRPEPLALLHLAAALRKQSDDVPEFMDGHAYFACETRSTDTKYTFDHMVIFTLRRD